jgi:hypothetical protein
MKKIRYYLTFSFLPNNLKFDIKVVSWAICQFIIGVIFNKEISLEKWLWDVYYEPKIKQSKPKIYNRVGTMKK